MTTSIPAENDAISAAQAAIEAFFSPVLWPEFISEYWDRAPMHVSGDASALVSLADPVRIRKLIETGAPWQFRRMPEMYLDGHKVPQEDLIDLYVDMDGREARSPKLSRIKSLLDSGATVNSFGQESHFPGLAALRQNFAGAFCAEVEVATFYSQKNHQGLAPHYDCVEIFVFQISGRKRWYVSSQRVDAPVVGYGKATWFDAAASHAQIDLEPGDVLYLPRGTFHQACALSDESLHATVAVKMPMYLDMLTTLGDIAPNLDEIRGYMPIGGPVVWAQERLRFLEHLRKALEVPAFAEALQKLLITRAGL